MHYALRRHQIKSTLAQVTPCFLTAPCVYMKQCWIIINTAPWHWSEENIQRSEYTVKQDVIWHFWNLIQIARDQRVKWYRSPLVVMISDYRYISRSISSLYSLYIAAITRNKSNVAKHVIVVWLTSNQRQKRKVMKLCHCPEHKGKFNDVWICIGILFISPPAQLVVLPKSRVYISIRKWRQF